MNYRELKEIVEKSLMYKPTEVQSCGYFHYYFEFIVGFDKIYKILIIIRTLVRYPLSSINLSASTSSTSYFIKHLPAPLGRVGGEYRYELQRIL